MSILHPLILWALPLVLTPLLVHLLARSRAREQPWAAMALLLRAQARLRRRLRRRDLLLLLLRSAAVLCLVMGCAGVLAPWSSSPWPLGSAGPLVLILDDSASMQAIDERGTSAFDRMRRAARDLIAGADEGTRTSLIAWGTPTRVCGRSLGRDAALEMVARMKCRSVHCEGAREPIDWASFGEGRRIVFIGDGYGDAVPPEGAQIVSVQGERCSNVGIAALSWAAGGSQERSDVEVELRGTPGSRFDLRLQVDGALAARKRGRLGGEREQLRVSFARVLRPTQLLATLESDALSADNRFSIDLPGDRLPRLAIPGGEEKSQALRTAAASLIAAGGLQAELGAPGRELSGAQWIVVGNAPLHQELMEARSEGSSLLFLRSEAAGFETLAAALGLGALRTREAAAERPFTLRIDRPGHPALKLLAEVDPEGLERLAIRRRLEFPAADASWTSVATFNDGAPAIAVRDGVFLCAFSAEREDSDILQPAVGSSPLLPLLLGALKWSSRAPEDTEFHRLGDPLDPRIAGRDWRDAQGRVHRGNTLNEGPPGRYEGEGVVLQCRVAPSESALFRRGPKLASTPPAKLAFLGPTVLLLAAFFFFAESLLSTRASRRSRS